MYKYAHLQSSIFLGALLLIGVFDVTADDGDVAHIEFVEPGNYVLHNLVLHQLVRVKVTDDQQMPVPFVTVIFSSADKVLVDFIFDTAVTDSHGIAATLILSQISADTILLAPPELRERVPLITATANNVKSAEVPVIILWGVIVDPWYLGPYFGGGMNSFADTSAKTGGSITITGKLYPGLGSLPPSGTRFAAFSTDSRIVRADSAVSDSDRVQITIYPRARGIAHIIVDGVPPGAISVSVSISQQIDDAEILALEISGELLTSTELVEQIRSDLAAIRRAYPEMNEIHVLPSWVPGELIIFLTTEAAEKFANGEYHGWDSPNNQYGPVEMDTLSHDTFLLKFSLNYNPEPLSQIYSTAEGVKLAAPNGIIGDGNDIFSSEISIYTFKKGWGDCIAGCIHNHFWTFSVSGDSVALIDEYGDPLTSIKETQKIPSEYSLHQNYPNPFNPETKIQYDLPKSSHVRIEIFNMLGQKIRTLIDEQKPSGFFSVTWDGKDSQGREISSGVYLYRLQAGSFVASKKMLLLR